MVDRGCKIVGMRMKAELKMRHKTKPAEFTSFAAGVAKRMDESIRHWKSCRLILHDKLRKFSPPTPDSSPEPKKTELELKPLSRRAQLQKWKEEKEKQRQVTAGKKKKPFLAGVYRVSMKLEFPPPVKPFQFKVSRVTQSQTAAAKSCFKFGSTTNEAKTKKVPTKQEALIDNKKVNEKKKKVVPEKKPKEATSKKTKAVEKKKVEEATPLNETPKIPPDPDRSTKSPDALHLVHSPNVTMSRGKENIRKENKMKMNMEYY